MTTSKVYLIKACERDGEAVLSQKARTLFQKANLAKCFQEKDFTAVKIHMGEEGNTTYIKAPCLRGLIEELQGLGVKPFVTDTSTLYTGQRHNAIDHTTLAERRGFSVSGLGVPFIAPDGLFGTSEMAVSIPGVLHQEVLVAYDIVRSQSLLSVAHFTGHLAAGAGATLKTLGMGCASRKGKMRQHASFKPSIKETCVQCGQCVRYCPEQAITMAETRAQIDPDRCIGCAECVAMCRYDAVQYDWQQESQTLQQAVAEHALGVVRGKEGRAAFINFLISITKDCDCFDTSDMPRVIDDIGIVASTDPVALDQASLDLIEQAGHAPVARILGRPELDPSIQIRHAEHIGLGSSQYELMEL